jgi:hypothetical protein
MLPPDLVAKLNECAKTNFIGARDTWFFRQSLFSWVVIVGLVLEGPELIHEMLSIARANIRRFKSSITLLENHVELAKVAAFVGWIFIIVGLVGELKAGSKIADLSASSQGCSDAKVTKATLEAGDAAASAKTAHEEADAVKGIADEARADARDALTKAQSAQRELAHAEADAAKAQTVASKALSTSDKAESHLADAMRRAKELTDELDRLTTPRHLFHKTKIAAPLKAFRGTEYVFIGTCADKECFDLVLDIDELLELAGWKRIKGPPLRIGLTQFRIHGDKDFAVDESVSTGTGISAETPNGWDSIKAVPENQLAEHIRAALALNQVLALNVSPSENTGRLVGIDLGTSTVVRIDVGRKPL